MGITEYNLKGYNLIIKYRDEAWGLVVHVNRLCLLFNLSAQAKCSSQGFPARFPGEVVWRGFLARFPGKLFRSLTLETTRPGEVGIRL